MSCEPNSIFINIGTRRRKVFTIIAMIVLIILLTCLAAGDIKSREIKKDAKQNAVISFHLLNTGRFSEDGLSPTYYREPLPIALTALHWACFMEIPKTATIKDLTTNPYYVQQILRGNLLYVLGLFFAIWWLTWRLTRSHLVAAFAIFGSWLFFLQCGSLLNDFYTELMAGLLLVLITATGVWMVQTRHLVTSMFVGVALGAFALTKASGLYVALVTIPLLALVLWVVEPTRWRQASALALVMATAFTVTVTPWMARNYVNFGEFAIAQRGGIVLLTRAIKNQMTEEEYAAAFYVYAPSALRKHFFERYLGYREADLQPGGRWARLKRMQPGDEEARRAGDVKRAISYYAKAWAMQTRWLMELKAQGLSVNQVDMKEDDMFEISRSLSQGLSANQIEIKELQMAKEMIRTEPGKHLQAILPFAWRGFWTFPHRSSSAEVLANLMVFSVFLAFPFIALLRRRVDWFVFSLFGGGLFWFYSILTHFHPRYSEPLIPVAILSLLLLVHDLFALKIQSKGNGNEAHNSNSLL